MIENLSTKKLYDNEYNKIMKEMKLLTTEYNNHKFELLLLGTNNKFYSNLDYSLEPLKKTKSLRKMINFSLRLLRRYLSYRKKILVSYLNYVWTADLILNNIEPAPVRWVEYPWAIMNSKLSNQMKILDIGSGRSLFPFFLASKGHDVVSIDNDDVLMDRISPKLAEMFRYKS